MISRQAMRFAIALTLVALAHPPAVSAGADEQPIDVRGAVRGTCAKDEVTTGRGCVVLPKITKKVDPTYPEAARLKHVQGKITVTAVIETDGTVSTIQVIDSSRPGYGFEDATVAAMTKWRYKPATIAGVPVRVLFSATTRFSLK